MFRQRASALKREREIEDCSKSVGSTIGSGSVQGPVGILDETAGGIFTVHTTRLRAEAIKRSQAAGGGEVKDRSVVVGAADLRYAIQVAVGGLNERCLQIVAVCTTAFGASVVNDSQRAARSDFENRSSAVGPADDRGSVEVPAAGWTSPVWGNSPSGQPPVEQKL